VFTSNGTFTIPSGVTKVKVTVVGGGGGGSVTLGTGTSGGSSTVASGTQTITTLTGGGGEIANGSNSYQPVSGTGTNGDLNLRGTKAEVVAGGVSVLAGSYGAGGRGGLNDSSNPAVGGGGGGAAIKWLAGLTPGNTLSVTVGAGGLADSGGIFPQYLPTNGQPGAVIFEW
jgi:hypothetical protein